MALEDCTRIRVQVSLDERIPEEAAVIALLARYPKSRRNEVARKLIVSGLVVAEQGVDSNKGITGFAKQAGGGAVVALPHTTLRDEHSPAGVSSEVRQPALKKGFFGEQS